jgi:DNA-binding IclR family transcriptional regulator
VPTAAPKDPDHRTAGRVLDIVELLAYATHGLSLTDLSQELHAAKSSLFPLLKTLVGRGYLVADEAGKYRLSSKLFELGVKSLGERDLREVARPALKLLSKHTGEAVLLAVLASDKGAVLYVDKVESEHRIRYSAGLGERRPLHSSSSGKVMLAFMSEAERAEVLKALKLVRFTPQTVGTRKELLAEIARVREQGACVNVDQSAVGRCGIAVPVFDHRGEVVAAVSLGAPRERALPQLDALVAEVKTTAATISKMLGYMAPPRSDLRSPPP